MIIHIYDMFFIKICHVCGFRTETQYQPSPILTDQTIVWKSTANLETNVKKNPVFKGPTSLASWRVCSHQQPSLGLHVDHVAVRPHLQPIPKN